MAFFISVAPRSLGRPPSMPGPDILTSVIRVSLFAISYPALDNPHLLERRAKSSSILALRLAQHAEIVY